MKDYARMPKIDLYGDKHDFALFVFVVGLVLGVVVGASI